MMELLGEREPHYSTLRGVMRDQPHFENESVLEVHRIPENDPIKQYRCVKSSDWELFPAGVLDKLIAGGFLVRESKLSGQYLFHKRMAGLDVGQVDLFEVARTMTNKIEEFDERTVLRVVTEFSDKYRKRPWTLHKAMAEDLYFFDIVGIMAKADPLRVDIDYNYLNRFRKRPKPDSPYTRSVQELEVWFQSNYEDILGGRPYDLPPRAILADDDSHRSFCFRLRGHRQDLWINNQFLSPQLC